MFERLGGPVTRHPVRVLTGWLLIAVIGAVGAFWGFGHGALFERIASTHSLVAGSESDRVDQLTSSATSGEQIILVASGLEVATQSSQLATVMATQRQQIMALDDVIGVVDPFQLPDPSSPQARAMLSTAGDGFVVVVTVAPDLDEDAAAAVHDQVLQAAADLQTALRGPAAQARVDMLSDQLLTDSLNDMVEHDLVRGEVIGLPVALVLLVVVFGGLLAATLPLIGAVVSILIGLGSLWGLTFLTDVDSFILNIISIIGLALSIDYGLLVVSRYREQITQRLSENGYEAAAGRLPGPRETRTLVREATRATIATAGRTVFFSALTIAFAISGLLAMSSGILRMIAAGGVIVTLLAVSTASTLVPAMIVILGPRLLRPAPATRIPGLRSLTRVVGDSSTDRGVFSRLAAWVHRRPIVIMLAVLAVLALMAWPIQNLRMRTDFTDYIPPDSSVGTAYHTLQDNYPALATPSITVVAKAPAAQTAGLVAHLGELDGVSFVGAPTPLPGDPGMTSIGIRVDAEDQIGQQVTDLVLQLREHHAGYPILVGGPAAVQHDFIRSVIDDAPKAAAIMMAAVLVLLFLMTGSLIVPVKALLINSLSLVASLGTTSWIFENGHLGMPRTEGMETFIVACTVAFGFGLAMDYEVFLLARIKEYWDAGHSNDEAVELGLQRSGRIITSAAAIIVAVFMGFTFADMLAIKQIGVALAITVITDASLVRMLLVPATMTILGRWNWWAPAPLRALHERFRIVH